MSYELVGDGPAGFNASIDGKTLKVSAADGTSVGTGGAVQVKAKDPRGLEATATYKLSVTASNRPKPVANDDLSRMPRPGSQSPSMCWPTIPIRSRRPH